MKIRNAQILINKIMFTLLTFYVCLSFVAKLIVIRVSSLVRTVDYFACVLSPNPGVFKTHYNRKATKTQGNITHKRAKRSVHLSKQVITKLQETDMTV